jgi:multicomponent Na+:H+ antiporter subunit D
VSALPLIAVLLPLVGGVLIAIFGEDRPRLRISLALAATVGVAAVIGVIAAQRLSQGAEVGWVHPLFGGGYESVLVVRLVAQPLGLVLAVIAAFLWPLTVIYSVGYMAHEHSQNRFFTYLVMVEGAAMGICLAGDLLTFFIFYELLTLLVYPLVVHEDSEEAIHAGRTYLAYLLVGETLVFGALFVVVSAAGGVPVFTGGGVAEQIGLSSGSVLAVLLLGFWGFAAKAAVMPMHAWLPDAMIAPTPVSAVLHAVAVVNVGVLGIFTLLYTVVGVEAGRDVWFNLWAPWVAAITIIGASLVALRQDEIKRRLAYSTISQLGYMVMGASLLSPFGLTGGVLHMFAHSLMKIVLFFCAGIIITQTGKIRFSEIAGLAKRLPVTMACFTVGAAGMVGLPPVVGWISKWVLLQGTFSSGQWALSLVILVSAMLNLGYYLPPVVSAYFGRPEDAGMTETTPGLGRRREAPLSMLIPTVAITVAALVFGIWPRFPYWLADQAVTWAFGVVGGG